MTDINVGDYVVHRDYGIGQFVGLKIIESSEGVDAQELLMIKYEDYLLEVNTNVSKYYS